jgi:hypothetical protein
LGELPQIREAYFEVKIHFFNFWKFQNFLFFQKFSI